MYYTSYHLLAVQLVITSKSSHTEGMVEVGFIEVESKFY